MRRTQSDTEDDRRIVKWFRIAQSIVIAIAGCMAVVIRMQVLRSDGALGLYFVAVLMSIPAMWCQFKVSTSRNRTISVASTERFNLLGLSLDTHEEARDSLRQAGSRRSDGHPLDYGALCGRILARGRSQRRRSTERYRRQTPMRGSRIRQPDDVLPVVHQRMYRIRVTHVICYGGGDGFGNRDEV